MTEIDVSRGAVLKDLGDAFLISDHKRQKEIFFDRIVPNPAFSNNEYRAIGIKVGAFDEGEEWSQNDEAYAHIPDPVSEKTPSPELTT